MDASEAEASTENERTEEHTASAQEDGREKSKKACLKRAAGANTKKKKSTKVYLKRAPDANVKKKPKKARVSSSAQPNYTVHQGEDMLLIVSNSSSPYEDLISWLFKRNGSKEKLAKGEAKPLHAMPKLENKPVMKEEVPEWFVTQQDDDYRWGQNLPEEVLINIFQMVVNQEGAVPFLCRVGSVCRLWNAAASTPILWRRVTLGHCWIAPGKKQGPKTKMRVKDTLDWLAQNRFSQLQDFSLYHWTKNVNYALEVVSQYCPHLCSLKLSYCTGVTAAAFRTLGLNSSSLHSIDVQFSEFQVEGLLEYLVNHGSRIRQLLFTHGQKNDKLLAAVTRGCCPELELLEVNTRLDSRHCELPVCIPALQVACPKLKTFRMLNVRPLRKAMRSGVDSTSGFPFLEELCIATTSYSYLTDKDLWNILFDSTKLRVLDLRGCSGITPSCLAALPCLELEYLFWGQYFSRRDALSSPKTGLGTVTQKWSQTLQELDIANHLFTEEDLELAMSHLCYSEAETLRSLNLSGTKITPRALRPVIQHTTALGYLNLSSCRYLPRGMKRIYRCQEEIRQLLDKLE
ncbi:F-box/LRR-repeat protein 6 [Archocentrus centrarchus]|uniref:F-box/LRR-repeat protein 6 n=1 Tax=Archocentrus centrarchus TaxID=63155 RepID=UPI0011EA166C|nr:F-box/LRR-repeat protein 6 [Archocentrus centrarchus]